MAEHRPSAPVFAEPEQVSPAEPVRRAGRPDEAPARVVSRETFGPEDSRPPGDADHATRRDTSYATTPGPSPDEPPEPVGALADRAPTAHRRSDVSRETRIIVIANQKGGVGKTTTAVNIATALALHGARVLALDLDPQGNASTGFGIPHPIGTPSTYDVIVHGTPIADVLQPGPESPCLSVVPSTVDLAGAEVELVPLIARENRLRRALEAYLAAAAERPDFVILDCPPSLGLLTVNALVAATEVLIPIQCEYYALEGLGQLTRNLDLVRAHLNPGLRIGGILLTMYDARTRLAEQVAADVRAHFATDVLSTVIPRSVRLSEAPSYGQSVLAYDPSSRGAQAYLAAAAELRERGGETVRTTA